jgi:hypothetical protein
MYDSFTFTHNGREYVAELHFDDHHGAPWIENDGHGPVSEWTTRSKRPGEIILSQDTRGRARRYYDFAAACKLARADKWNAKPYGVPGETPRQRAAKAAKADFEYLKAWCNDDWHYCGVIVRAADDCKCCGQSESLWGIESNCDEYIKEVAQELAQELAHSAPSKAA